MNSPLTKFSQSTLVTILASIAFLLLNLSTPSAAAQHRSGGFAFASAHGTTHAAAPNMRSTPNRIANRRGGRRNSIGYGFYPDYYPYDSPFAGGQDEPTPPRDVAQAPLAPAATAPTKPVEPLVVELRGDHWVRLTGYGASEISNQLPASQIIPAAPAATSTKSKSKVADAAAVSSAEEKLPPAILVFRDGHREEISRYTIINKTIAVKSDYYASGSWTRKIQIADLNVPATLQANRDANTKFALPTRPNEVVMRP
jgi:hypothetical protein